MTTKGRPPYEPTDRERAQVKMLSGMGVRDYEIAKVIGISEPTLRKYFWQELDLGHIEATAKVAQSLFKQATDPVKPNVTAAIFWLKCRGGWREESEQVGKKEAAAAAALETPSESAWASVLQ